MARTWNLGRILDEADTARRMSLPPVRIEGEGEEISTPDTPIRVIGLGHDTLEQVDDTWKGELGLDLRPDLANEAIFNPQPRPAVARRVQTMPGLDLRADLAELDAEDKAISQVSGAVGDVAGRAMAGRGQALAGGTPTTPRGMVADAMKGAARGPLVPQKGAGGGIPPEVAEFVAKQVKPEGPDQSGMDAARKRQGLGNGLAMLSEQLTAAADMGSGMKSQPGLYRGMREAAEREVTDQQAREDAVRRFVAEKMARDDKFAANATAQERYDAGQRRLTEQDRLAAEQRTADAARQAELDALNRRKVESEIAENEAQAARTKAQPRGVGRGPAPVSEEDALKMQKLRQDVEKGRQDVAGEDPRKVAAAEASRRKLKGLISSLRSLHKEYGTEFGGDAGTNMRQIAKQIQIEAKNLSELGALSGPDLGLMEDIAGTDPSSLGANIKGALSGGFWDNTQASLDQLEKWTDNNARAAREVYGPRSEAGLNASPGPGPAAQPSSADVRPTGRTKTDANGVTWEEMSDGSARKRGG